MNTQEKFLAFILAIGIMFLILGFANIAGATPSGGYGQPFYTLNQQGKTMVMGTATCGTSGSAVFLSGSSGAQSLMMRNAGSVNVYVCPAENTVCTAANYGDAMYLQPNDALVLDKATSVTGGWKCWSSTSATLHYLAEQ